mmetsp:Transcript_11038/g.45829  ORF Transcript_11038/g.45829 Transcript_11038/m.45829 type:complete len:238 (-) Transcript_11038:1994-2707(-)
MRTASLPADTMLACGYGGSATPPSLSVHPAPALGDAAARGARRAERAGAGRDGSRPSGGGRGAALEPGRWKPQRGQGRECGGRDAARGAERGACARRRAVQVVGVSRQRGPRPLGGGRAVPRGASGARGGQRCGGRGQGVQHGRDAPRARRRSGQAAVGGRRRGAGGKGRRGCRVARADARAQPGAAPAPERVPGRPHQRAHGDDQAPRVQGTRGRRWGGIRRHLVRAVAQGSDGGS